MRVLLFTLIAFSSIACRGCDDLGDPTNESCGNDVRELREVCDGTDLAGESCETHGFDGGELACAPTCGGFVVADCTGAQETGASCGMCEPGEVCLEEQCVPFCEGEPFDSDATVDFDVRTRRVTGEVTFGGRPATDVAHRGELVFTGEAWWDPVTVEVPASGEVDVVLSRGPYEVEWRTARWDQPASVRLGSVAGEGTPDLDVPTWIDVPGRVTIDGETPSATEYDGERGRLLFDYVNDSSSPSEIGTIGIVIGHDGDGEFVAPLRSGQYRIWWTTEREGKHVIFLRDWTLDDDGTGDDLIVDLPLRRVEFRVSIDGRAFTIPDGTGVDARLQLYRDPHHVEAIELRNLFAAGYRRRDRFFVELDERGIGSAWLFADDYDVALSGSDPVNGAVWLRQAHPLGESREEVFDIETGRLEGVVTRNDRRVPNSAVEGTSRGTVRLFRGDGSWWQTELSARGAAEFSTRLPAGSWEVSVAGNYWSRALPLAPHVAPGRVRVERGETTEVDVDVPAVRVGGEITVNGERAPEDLERQTRAALQFSDASGVIWHTVPIPPRGPAAYDIILSPGEYRWSVVRWWYATGGDDLPSGVLPIGEWDAGTLELDEATRRDIDLRLYDVEVELTLDGKEPGDVDGPRRGVVWFENGRNSGRVSREVDVPAYGPAVIRTSLYPGRYAVAFQPEAEASDLSESPAFLDLGLVVADDVSIAYDIGQVELQGRVTLDGEPMPTSPRGRGWLEFLRVPDVAQATTKTFVSSNSTDYEIDLLPGQYEVMFVPDPGHPELPRNTTIVHYACGERSYR